MTKSVGIMYHHFPSQDNMLLVYLDSGNYEEILPEWHGQDASDFHVVVAVTDEETSVFYRKVKEKSKEYASLLKHRISEAEPWDIEIKPLFRFDSVRNAERFVSIAEQYKDIDERNEYLWDLRLKYDNGWEPIREITNADFENPDGF